MGLPEPSRRLSSKPILYYIVLDYIILYHIILHYIIMYHIILYDIILCYTILYIYQNYPEAGSGRRLHSKGNVISSLNLLQEGS